MTIDKTDTGYGQHPLHVVDLKWPVLAVSIIK